MGSGPLCAPVGPGLLQFISKPWSLGWLPGSWVVTAKDPGQLPEHGGGQEWPGGSADHGTSVGGRMLFPMSHVTSPEARSRKWNKND